MKKRGVFLATAIAIGALVFGGATLAYYTSQDTATNVFVTGNVDISIVEDMSTEKNYGEPIRGNWTTENIEGIDPIKGNRYIGVVPGDVILKQPLVYNVGKNDAYLRVKVDITVDGILNKDMPVDQQLILGTFDGGVIGTNTKWETSNERNVIPDEDGYIYYDGIYKVGTGYMPFRCVYIPDTWNRDFINSEVSIIVTAEAVQSDNLDLGVDENGNPLSGVAAAKKAFELIQ